MPPRRNKSIKLQRLQEKQKTKTKTKVSSDSCEEKPKYHIGLSTCYEKYDQTNDTILCRYHCILHYPLSLCIMVFTLILE